MDVLQKLAKNKKRKIEKNENVEEIKIQNLAPLGNPSELGGHKKILENFLIFFSKISFWGFRWPRTRIRHLFCHILPSW